IAAAAGGQRPAVDGPTDPEEDHRMVTMTIAHSDVLDAVRADLPPGVASEVRLVEWGVRGPLPVGVDPAEVDVVVVPNFAVGAAMFARVTELPALRAIQLPSAGFEHALGHVP